MKIGHAMCRHRPPAITGFGRQNLLGATFVARVNAPGTPGGVNTQAWARGGGTMTAIVGLGLAVIGLAAEIVLVTGLIVALVEHLDRRQMR